MSSGNSPSQHPEETVTKDAVMAEDAPEMATAEDAPEMATAEDAVTAEKTAATAATESSIPFRTADGYTMRIPRSIACKMGSINFILNDLSDEDLGEEGISLHNDATHEVMKKVVNFLERHQGDPEMTAEELKEWKKKPLEGDDKIFEISRDVHDEERRIDIMRDRMAQYYTLTRAINYLDIPLMLHTMLKAMNQFITGKTPGEIAGDLGFTLDMFTEGDVEAAKKEHPWLGNVHLPGVKKSEK